MSKKVAKPVSQIKKLEKWDESGDDMVEIRQATQGVVDKLENFRTSNNEYVWNDAEQGKTTMKTNRGVAEIRRLQVRETLVGSNLRGEDDQPIFKTFRFDEESAVMAFDAAWDNLPPDLATEIFEKVLEVNPQWAPKGE